MTEMGQNDGFPPLSEKVFTQNCGAHLLDECCGMIRFGVTLAQVWPSSHQNDLKWVVPDHYLKKYSHNPFQTWWVHLLGECSALICFWLRWPDFGHLVATKCLKMVVSDHYLKKKCLRNPIQNWCVQLLSVQNWFAFQPRWPNFGPLVAPKWLKWWFPTIVWKSIYNFTNDSIFCRYA